jgi:hypothetical protein
MTSTGSSNGGDTVAGTALSCARFNPTTACLTVSDITLIDSEEGITFSWELIRTSDAPSCPELTEFSVLLRKGIVSRLRQATVGPDGIATTTSVAAADAAATSNNGTTGPTGQIWQDGVDAGDHVAWAIPSVSEAPLGMRFFVSFTLKGVEKVSDVCTLDTAEACEFVVAGAPGCFVGRSDSSFLQKRKLLNLSRRR